MKFKIAAITAATIFASAWTISAALLVDRGLPTANLNNAAGVNRANVDWGSTSGVSLVGDTFVNTSSQSWSINSIRLWTDGVIETPPTPILWGGVNAGPISVVSSSGTLTPTTYLNGQGYQASGGTFYQLFQIDFAVNILLAPGQTYSFFLDGNDPSYPPYIFVEASNRALSGSPQDGADDVMLRADVIGSVLGNVQTWTSLGDGWDKASDVNVQVIGTVVPEPSTYLAGALLLLPFGVNTLRKFRNNRQA